MAAGIYIHIPFCRKKCDYCDFYSIPLSRMNSSGRKDLVGAYLSRLIREIDERADLHFREVDTIYLGGGTPSLLDPEDVNRIIYSIHQRFTIAPGVEITIECNPEDFSVSRCTQYRDAGITRVTLGIQTMNERLHGILGRSARPVMPREIEEFISVKGIAHCCDIIAGIPGQTESDLFEDLTALCSFMPEHISAYILTIEESTPICTRIRPTPAMESSQRILFRQLMDFLKSRGYIHYEISNFALPGHESRHNMKYWTWHDYFGFGAGAHSFIDNQRFINDLMVGDYIRADRILLREDIRGLNARMAEFFMTGLRLLDGISMNRFKEVFSIPIPDELSDRIKKLSGKGQIIAGQSDGDIKIRLSEEGMFLMDSVLLELIDPLL